MTPQRIQRQRTKGWKAPEGARYVGRGTKWGNPWRVGALIHVESPLPSGDRYFRELEISPEIAVALYAAAFALDAEEIRTELAGLDLMCWCPLEDGHGNRYPCHADWLLAVANGTQPKW